MTEKKITVRKAKKSDARSILEAHFDAVHNIAFRDYSVEIIALWSPLINDHRVQHFLKNTDNEFRIVAELDGKVVGFGALVLKQNELRACYVSSYASRCGIGTAILQKLESIAVDEGLTYLQMLASITAEPFYNHHGYQSVKRSYHLLRQGMKMAAMQNA